jgi:hypothetical protein
MILEESSRIGGSLGEAGNATDGYGKPSAVFVKLECNGILASCMDAEVIKLIDSNAEEIKLGSGRDEFVHQHQRRQCGAFERKN